MTVVLPKAIPLEDILNKLGEVPEIEVIGEKPFKEEPSPSLLKKAAALLRLENRPRKNIFVTLKKEQAGQTQVKSIHPVDRVYRTTSAHTGAR